MSGSSSSIAGCQVYTGRSEIVVDLTGHLAVCGRAVSRDVVVDGMLLRTAGKSIRYAGEVIVPEPLDAVRRYCHLKTASGNSQRRIERPLELAPVSEFA